MKVNGVEPIEPAEYYKQLDEQMRKHGFKVTEDVKQEMWKAATVGVKDDKHKLRTDLLSVPALEGTADVLSHGADKYGDRNWELGLDYNRPYGAALRHILAWWRGEDIDPDSGLHHLDHAACEIMFLQHYVKTQTGIDNRPRNVLHSTVQPTEEVLYASKPKFKPSDHTLDPASYFGMPE